MLELKGLSYQVEDNGAQTDILRGIDLTIDNNKFVVITGPNGGGKTTLAKAIMGLVPATGGQILWNGQDITKLSITERAKLGISYGFQQPPRFKGLRVRDLLALASGNRNLSRDECCSYLNRVGLCAAELCGPGDGHLPLRRRGQAHRDRDHSGPPQRPAHL